MVELQTRSINERGPLVSVLRVTEAYWWRDEEDQVNVAMQARPQGPYLGTVWLSMTLGKPPAGSAREYQLGRENLYAYYELNSLPQSRFRSFRGIAAVWPQDDGTLRGRARVWALHRHFTLLLGWRAAAQVLIVLEFQARESSERGLTLREQSWSENWVPREHRPPSTQADRKRDAR